MVGSNSAVATFDVTSSGAANARLDTRTIDSVVRHCCLSVFAIHGDLDMPGVDMVAAPNPNHDDTPTRFVEAVWETVGQYATDGQRPFGPWSIPDTGRGPRYSHWSGRVKAVHWAAMMHIRPTNSRLLIVAHLKTLRLNPAKVKRRSFIPPLSSCAERKAWTFTSDAPQQYF